MNKYCQLNFLQNLDVDRKKLEISIYSRYTDIVDRIKGYVQVHCDMLGNAVVFWARVILADFDLFGYVWVCFGMFENVNV